MPWIIVIAIIFVVLFVMILVPKAAKGYTDSEKLKDVAWAKGFRRIYFLASAIWIGGLTFLIIFDPPTDPEASYIPMIIVTLAPIPLYYFIKWIFGGFKKDQKKKK
tara:strand:- start:276 stop:593 length:318 start_codon:yes stop_codon:yes gene_type:complete